MKYRNGLSLVLVIVLVAGSVTTAPATAQAPDGGPAAQSTATFERLSVTPEGDQFPGQSLRPSSSADGRHVAFLGGSHVYVRDRELGTTERVTTAQVGPGAGGPANSSSGEPQLSASGRHVVFASRASDLVSGDGNGFQDIFVQDRETGVIRRVGRRSSQSSFERDQLTPSISGDGDWVAWVTTGLDWFGFDLREKVFLVGPAGGFPVEVSRYPRDEVALHPRVNHDGTRVAYLARIEGNWVLVLFDRTAGTWQEIATVGPATLHPFSLHLARPSISPDGRTIGYLTYSEDQLRSRIEVWEEGEGSTTLFEADASATQQKVEWPSMSADGQRVLFTLVDGVPSGGVIASGQGRIHLYDRASDTSTLVTAGADGGPSPGDARYPALSGDGSLASFTTTGALDPSDTNGVNDVYGAALAASDSTPPTWPGGAELTVEDVGTTVLRLRWPAAADDVGVSGYLVSAGDTLVAETQALEYSVSGLDPDTTYEFFVRPRDAAGNAGEPLSVSATTLGESGEGEAVLVAGAEPGGIVRLQWDPSAAAPGGYRVLRAVGDGDFEPVAETAETAHTDSGLLASTTYRYLVMAVDAAGAAHPHTVEATATTPALTIDSVEWSAPRLPRTREVRLGSDLSVVVRGEPNRSVIADVAYTTWDAGDGSTAGAPVPGELELALPEEQPGTYRGSVPVAEGIASLTGIAARMSDGEPAHDVTAAAGGLPAQVSGLIVARVDAPAGSMPGAKLYAWSEDSLTGEQRALDGGGDVELAVSPASYYLRILRADGVLAAELDSGPVAGGRSVDVELTPELPSTVVARVVDGEGAPVPDARVRITDEADGRVVATERTNADGVTRQVPGLGWRTHLRATAETDPLEFTSTDGTVVLEPGANEVTVVLAARPRGAVEGHIVDHRGEGVPGVAVRVHQSIEGMAANSAGTTDAEGRYRVGVLAGPAQVSASHRSVPAPDPVHVEVPEGGTAVADFTLPLPEDYEVTVDVYTRFAGSDWQGPLPIDWRVAVHLGLRLQAPTWRQLAARTTTVRGMPGQRVEACVNGREAGLPAVCESVVLGEDPSPTIELRLAQAGAVRARLRTLAGEDYRSSYQAIVQRVEQDGSLRFVARHSGSGPQLLVPVTEPGEHEIVVTGGLGVSSVPVRTTVDEFAVGDAGTLVLAPRGPFAGAGNALEPVRPVVLPGDVLEWRTSYRNGGSATLSGAVAMLPVPAGTEVVAAGTLRDGEPVEATLAGGYLEVALGELGPGAAGTLRHRVRLTDDRLAEVGGSALIRAAGLAPALVGTGAATVAGVTLEAPEQSATAHIATSGRAPAGSDVEVLTGDLVLARAVASTAGYWQADVELPDLGRGHEHPLAARTTHGGAQLQSDVAYVIVDDTLPVMTSVAVSQPDGRRIVFDPSGGVARFPYVWVPGRPMVVEVSFDDPDRVDEVEVTIGTNHVIAERQGGTFVATLPGGRGDLYIDYSGVSSPTSLTELAGRLPTEVELRSRLREPFSGFDDVTVVESPGSNHSTVSARLPSVGPDVSMRADLTMARDVSYTPTAEDAEAERVTGVPVYGLSWQESADGLTSELVAYVPEHALADGATAADALALLGAALAVSGGQAFGAPSPALAWALPASSAGVLAQAQVAVPAARIGFQWAFQGVTAGDDVYGTYQSSGFYDQLSRLLDQLDDCPPDIVAAYTQRAENLARSALIVQVTQAAMAVAGLFVGPATFGLGTLAIWGATAIVGRGMDYAIGNSFDNLKREIEELDCVEKRKRKKRAEPVWIHDPSGVVYEAVESNTLEGVIATAMHAPSPHGPWTVWDAGWFGQDNPQSTGRDGYYGWDVPEGWWMVAYSKDGYLTAYSDALEVLPPHFDVNEGLVPVASPDVADLAAVGGSPTSSILVVFDQYMRADVVEALGIEVADGAGEVVAGTLVALDAQDSPAGERLARSFRFTPDEPLEPGGEVTVTVPDVVQSHAGRTLAASVTATLEVGHADAAPPEVQATVSPEPSASGWYRDAVTVTLTASDAGSGVAAVSWTLAGAQSGSGSADGDSATVPVTAEGETTLTYVARDRAGNASDAGEVTVRIDRTAPDVTCTATPDVLWPPNHQLVDVTVTVGIADALSGPGGIVLEQATSSDPDDAPGEGDGSTTGDVAGWALGEADTHGRLRAERDEDASPRVYVLRYRASDAAGNAAACAAAVVVPLDRSGGGGRGGGGPGGGGTGALAR